MPDRAPLPEHVTMPLLDIVIRNSLDVDYQHVADVRGARPVEDSPVRRWRAATIVGLFGLLIVIAAVQTRAAADGEALAREELIQQIDAKRQTLRSSNRLIGDLREEIEQLTARQTTLTRTERAAVARNDQTGALAGYTAVRGEGVRIHLDDAEDGSSDGAVRDEDLATLVNGLWSAGAEAISVNGFRLTTLTGIRSAGSAILIRDRALRPPYTLLVVGDINLLQSRFVETSSGVAFLGLRSRFGFEFQMDNDRNLRLPAAPRPDLVRAAPAPTKSVEERP